MTRKRAISLALVATALILGPTTGCGNQESTPAHERGGEEAEHPGHEDDRDEHGEEEPQVVRLSSEQLAGSGIRIETVGPGAIDSGTELLGEVHPNGDELAHIVPRFPGIVREVHKNAGDRVRAGDVLAIVESSDSLAPYPIKTLIDGVVLAKHLTKGEAVDREDDAFVVADLSTVWVDLAVYQKDLAHVAIGQRVRIHAVGEGPDAEGAISYVTPAVDQATRTATARVVLDNAERKFMPGMFVTAHTLAADQAAVAVPREAIQTFADRPSVFVETPDGLAPRAVTLGSEGETRVEVLSGLDAGERIAVTNVFLLKAELARAEAEHEH